MNQPESLRRVQPLMTGGAGVSRSTTKSNALFLHSGSVTQVVQKLHYLCLLTHIAVSAFSLQMNPKRSCKSATNCKNLIRQFGTLRNYSRSVPAKTVFLSHAVSMFFFI